MATRSSRPAGPAPDAAALRERGLAHLARYTATEASLGRVLARGVDRWARRAVADGEDAATVAEQAGAARASVRGVVARLAQAGAVSDAVFAENRTRNLRRGGKSRRAVAAALAAKGVAPETARTALDTAGIDELAAALVLTRRKRIGPFREGDENRLRELGVMARAGYSQAVATEALRMTREEAEATVLRMLRG